MTPKEYGNFSADELDGFIAIFKEVDDFMFDDDSPRETDLDVPSWGRIYEISFGELAGLAMIGLGVFDQFLSAIDRVLLPTGGAGPTTVTQRFRVG